VCVVVYTGADVHMDLVNIPGSMSQPKNHGHTWMVNRSLLAVAESSSSYGCLRSSKNPAKVHIYFVAKLLLLPLPRLCFRCGLCVCLYAKYLKKL